jgi:hypothetical protein
MRGLLSISALLLLFHSSICSSAETNDLTLGWKKVPLKFKIQKPYDLEVKDRYRFDPTNAVHDFWVYFTDKPHEPPPNKTTARTEMRVDSFSAGEHMFDFDINIGPGTHACIAQVFDAKHGPVTMIIARPDGTVAVGNRDVIRTNAIGQWWNLKMTCDPETNGLIKIYVDNVLAQTYHSRGPREYYFKCGVYSRKDSDRSEARFRNIKVWEKDSAKEEK